MKWHCYTLNLTGVATRIVRLQQSRLIVNSKFSTHYRFMCVGHHTEKLQLCYEMHGKSSLLDDSSVTSG